MSYITDILRELGWADGFQIPISNLENKALEEEVARLSLKKVCEKTEFEASEGKLGSLDSHLKHIQQECEQNQSLLTVHTQQLQREEHKLRVLTVDKDKYEHDIKQSYKEISEVNERVQGKLLQLERYTKKLDTIKLETDWDEEALKAWEESLEKRDNDNEIIKKFSKQDARKYNELEARRQSLELEFANRKLTIQKTVSDICNYERMLERTGKITQNQLVERKVLIQQWKDSVKILHQRDDEIDKMEVQVSDMQELLVKETERLNEQKEFLKNEHKNNEDIERETQQLTFLNSKLRFDLNELTQMTVGLTSQTDTIRRTMIRIAHQLEKERGNKKNIHQEIATRSKRITKFRKSIVGVKEKCDQLKAATISAEECTKHVEKLIDYELKQQKLFHNDAEMLQNTHFRVQRDLQVQINDGKKIDIEIYGARTNINHLNKHIDDNKKELELKKEDAYELDFKIDEVLKNILIHENVIHNHDLDTLEAKYLQLTAKMAELSEVKNLLKDQVNKIRDDMRRLTTAVVADQNQLVGLKDKLQHQTLNFAGGEKQLKAIKSNIQEIQAEENILRLRVKQLGDSMKKEENCIYTLKKFKLSLEQATQGRILEIDAQKDILQVKRRNLNEDKGRLKADIAERMIRLDQFRKKYDIILATFGKDEGGETVSMTHIAIKNAQEKYFLQKEGDELDEKIKKAEQEIVAMENTLKVVNLTNSAFKKSLDAVDDDSNEMEQKKELEELILAASDKFRAKRKEVAAKTREVDELKKQLEDAEAECREYKNELSELEEECLKISRTTETKNEKLRRTESCLKVMQKRIRKKDKEKYDRDMEIRQLKIANECSLQKLLEMLTIYQEVAPLITRYAREYNVNIPDKQSFSTLSTYSDTSPSLVSCTSEKHLVEKRAVRTDSSTSNVAKVDIKFNL